MPPQTLHCSPAPRAPTRLGARPKKSRREGFPFAGSFSSLAAVTSSIVSGGRDDEEFEVELEGLPPLPEQAKHEHPPVPWHREQPSGASPRPTAQAAAPAVASTAPPMMASWTVAERRPWVELVVEFGGRKRQRESEASCLLRLRKEKKNESADVVKDEFEPALSFACFSSCLISPFRSRTMIHKENARSAARREKKEEKSA